MEMEGVSGGEWRTYARGRRNDARREGGGLDLGEMRRGE